MDMNAKYRVEGYNGIAFYLLGYELTYDEDYEWTGIAGEDTSRVRAVMVGDDRVHSIGVDELTKLEEGGYCLDCGQIGCRWHT